MRYSLSSRFRGTLLGALLGEFLSNYEQKPARNYEPSVWLKMAILCAESLIKQGKFDLQDWGGRLKELPPQNSITPGAILSSLPVVLTYHENLTKQQLNLQQLISFFQEQPLINEDNSKSQIQNPRLDNLVVKDGLLAVGYAIALALTEKLNPHTLIPEILTYLGNSQTPLPQQLQQVQNCLQTGAGLEKVILQLRKDAQPYSNSIALGFYCFLSTPEDFRLSVMRAVRTETQPQFTGAIAGILAGAYNSMAGIPILWRLTCYQTDELLHLSDRLFAIWAGVYAPSELEKTQLLSAIAAPRVIQVR